MTIENSLKDKTVIVEKKDKTKKSDRVLSFIKSIVSNNEGAGQEREQDIKEIWSHRSAKEKADELYDCLMSLSLAGKSEYDDNVSDYVVDKKDVFSLLRLRNKKNKEDKESDEGSAESTDKSDSSEQKSDNDFKPSPRLISRIKILSEDPDVLDMLSETYNQARTEVKEHKSSDIAQTLEKLKTKIKSLEDEMWKLESLFIQGSIRPDKYKTLKSDIEEVKSLIEEKRQSVSLIESLENYEKTQDVTDVVAMEHFHSLSEYKEQLDDGFVWLPSRLKVVEESLGVINQGDPKQTRLGVWLISEPGTGKTDLIRATAMKLTGQDRTKISCGPRTGDRDFVGELKVFPGADDPSKATYYDMTGSIASAITGYDYSFDTKPKRDRARVVELDEMPKLFSNDMAFSKIKDLFSLRDGDSFGGKPVLPGRVIFASGNVGGHHNNQNIPPALERHFKVIPVDYPEMSKENPELFEFMVSALMEKGVFLANKAEVEPHFVDKLRDLDDDQKPKISDGSTVLSEYALDNDPTKKDHGFLYRFAHAIKAVQDAYMARGGENDFIDYTKRPRLYLKTGSDGKSYVDESGADAITLSTTITLQDISGWIRTYKDQLARKDSMSLTEFMQGILKEKISEKHSESEKLEAIFNHYHLFDTDQVGFDKELLKKQRPLTPKEIGYLSPRVPRPLKIKRPTKDVAQGDGAQSDESRQSLAYEGINRRTEELVKEQITFDDEKIFEVVNNLTPDEWRELLSKNIIQEDLGFISETKNGTHVMLKAKNGEPFELYGLIQDNSHDGEDLIVIKSREGDVFRRIKIITLVSGIRLAKSISMRKLI